jgi:hypothetical protein
MSSSTSTTTNKTPMLSAKRAWPFKARLALCNGPKIEIADSKGVITTMPAPLFATASAQHDLVKEGKVIVPDEIGSQGVYQFVQRMKLFAQSATNPGPIVATGDTARDLQMCSAAEALGMKAYTQGVFNLYFARVNSIIPTMANIAAIGSVRTPCGDKIYKQMAYHIADKMWNGTFETMEAFTRDYLPTNPRLEAAINEVIAMKSAAVTRQEKYEARQAQRQEWARVAAEKEQRAKEWKNKNAAIEKEKKLAARKKQAEEDAKWKVVGESYRTKKRTGVKLFTPQEASYAWKFMGVRVPVKSG